MESNPTKVALPETPSPELYAVVAARRLQWDALLWQVPVISLTAQAFLFTIALSAGNSTLARTGASFLALLAALLSMQLMTRQRQAELIDADWLEAYERQHFGATFAPRSDEFQRQRVERRVGPFYGVFARFSGYRTWMAGFAAFGLAAATNFALALTCPGLF